MHGSKCVIAYVIFLWIAVIPMFWVLISTLNYGLCISHSHHNLTLLEQCVDVRTIDNFIVNMGSIIFIIHTVLFTGLYCFCRLSDSYEHFGSPTTSSPERFLD